MKKDHPWLEDMSRLASGAAGTLFDMKREAHTQLQGIFDEWLARTPLVKREEFEVVAAMATKAREENEKLKTQLEVLQATVDKLRKS